MSREKRTTPIVVSMSDSTELGLAFEDAGGLSGFGAQQQASVRFGSSDTIQALTALGILGSQWRDMSQFTLAMLLASLDTSGNKTESPAQSLVTAVDKLISLTEGQFLAPLKGEDYRKLIAARDKLINTIGTDENHPLTPLVHFMGNLIEKYKEESNVKIRNETLDTDKNKSLADAVLKPHRPEKTGRPADLPRLKLADLLAQEPEHASSDEIDTGPAVGHEVW